MSANQCYGEKYMSIIFNEKKKIFYLHSRSTSYIMGLLKGNLVHIYWGKRLESVPEPELSVPHCPRPQALYTDPCRRDLQKDTLPLEFSTYGNTDLRNPTIHIQYSDGSTVSEFEYVSHEITEGKPALDGLPSTFDCRNEAQTLVVRFADRVTKVEVLLSYTVFENKDVITRHVEIINNGPQSAKILSCMSMSVDFDESKLLALAENAKKTGADMLVLDDGWFGRRNDDTTSLGDWFVNTQKLPGGLSSLADKLRAMDMKPGIWVEPEMISEESELYRKHPDWCIHVNGRKKTYGRAQLVLDLSRREVCDYIVSVMTEVFESADISYVKWDMNRNMTDIGSEALPPKDREKHLTDISSAYTISSTSSQPLSPTFSSKAVWQAEDVLMQVCFTICRRHGRATTPMLLSASRYNTVQA